MNIYIIYNYFVLRTAFEDAFAKVEVMDVAVGVDAGLVDELVEHRLVKTVTQQLQHKLHLCRRHRPVAVLVVDGKALLQLVSQRLLLLRPVLLHRFVRVFVRDLPAAAWVRGFRDFRQLLVVRVPSQRVQDTRQLRRLQLSLPFRVVHKPAVRKLLLRVWHYL